MNDTVVVGKNISRSDIGVVNHDSSLGGNVDRSAIESFDGTVGEDQ